MAPPVVSANNNQLWRTRMCRYHEQGLCRWGSACHHAHSESELRSVPNLEKTSMCKALLAHGECLNANCTYAHDRSELRTTTAFFKTKMCFNASSCTHGENCRYAHDASELREPEMGKVTQIPEDARRAAPARARGRRGGQRARAQEQARMQPPPPPPPKDAPMTPVYYPQPVMQAMPPMQPMPAMYPAPMPVPVVYYAQPVYMPAEPAVPMTSVMHEGYSAASAVSTGISDASSTSSPLASMQASPRDTESPRQELPMKNGFIEFSSCETAGRVPRKLSL